VGISDLLLDGRDYQLKAVKALYHAFSGYVANVWNTRDEMFLRNLRKVTSICLHIDTLIGPVWPDFEAGDDRSLILCGIFLLATHGGMLRREMRREQ
jgi:hypothetical protein